MEHVFDTVCRCFGGVPAAASARSPNPSSPARREASPGPEIKRRTTGRLELQDKEWDGLFQHTTKSKQQTAQSNKPASNDLEHARAVAHAKLAAHPPSRCQTKPRSNKRKTPATKRDEIFRARRFDKPLISGGSSSARSRPQAQEGSFSHFLKSHKGVANALCFATPIRDDDEDEEDNVPLNQPDDDSTLNTCEDTIASTIVFDAKYSHLVENRPPMPLFSHFKVNEEEDQIRRIVATDSHNSLKMIRLMNESSRNEKVQLQDSSSEDEVPPPEKANALQHRMVRSSPRPTMVDELPPEPVKINSSGSSKSTASTTPSSSSPPFPEESGRVVRL